MKTIKITTPENIEIEYTLADIGSRAAAAVIDMTVQIIVLLIFAGSILLIKLYSPHFWDKYYGWIIGIALLVSAIISYGYFIIMELTMNGLTLGKKVMKLRTIRNNGQSITLIHSAIRNLFKLFIDYYGIGAIMIFFSKECKRVGDYAASTIVISEQTQMLPVTLESLQNIAEHFNYYITNEEMDLIRTYLARKSYILESALLREELKQHFIRRFEKLGVVYEGESFIDKL